MEQESSEIKVERLPVDEINVVEESEAESAAYRAGFEAGLNVGKEEWIKLHHGPGPDVGEAGAVFGFTAWLTSRYEESGPFSRYLDAAPAARLAGEFCRIQGWEVDDARFPRNLVPFPNDVPEGADEAHLRGAGTEEDPYRTVRHADDSAAAAVAEYAVWGARNDPRVDKSDWIRMWAQARQALHLPYGSDDWNQAYDAE